MIRRIISWLVSHGVDDLVLNLHHRPETLTAVVGDGADLGGARAVFVGQPRMLGSAGGPRLALPLVGADTFLVVNGDTLTDVDLAMLAAAHADIGRPRHAGARAQPRVPCATAVCSSTPSAA